MQNKIIFRLLRVSITALAHLSGSATCKAIYIVYAAAPKKIVILYIFPTQFQVSVGMHVGLLAKRRALGTVGLSMCHILLTA